MKKLFIGKSGNLFKKLIGSLVQMGISNIVTQNSDLIKSAGQFIIRSFFKKKLDPVSHFQINILPTGAIVQ